MLISLQIRDFAIVDQIAVEFEPGMTVLTGETGAGKSILVDAVSLVLGERGGSQLVRNGAKRAEFSAEFDVSALPNVRSWLEANALDQDDACLLRRIISAEGRSRAFINGNAVTMQQLKSLGELLLDIHGQHFHQSLGRRPVQRDLLDHFGELLQQRKAVEDAFELWHGLQLRLDDLLNADSDRASRLDLLEFQLRELDALDLREGEIDELLSERQKLNNSGKLADGVAAALARLSEDDSTNVSSLLADATRAVDSLIEFDTELGGVREMLESAGIQIGEAIDELQKYGDSVDMDPARRDWVEERLDVLQSTARKHRTTADELLALSEKLRTEYDELSHAEVRGKELEQQVTDANAAYQNLALALSKVRKKVAKQFSAAVTKAMGGLGMPGGVFEIKISPLADGATRAWGIDDIEFLISANPGQPPMTLARVASGGELSRMSLASQHFRISKVSDGKATRTGVSVLGKEERVEELARMLGGVEITQKTLDHAAEMLAGGGRKRA